MKPSILRQWYFKWLEFTWPVHNWIRCDCEICSGYRFEHKLNKTEDM